MGAGGGEGDGLNGLREVGNPRRKTKQNGEKDVSGKVTFVRDDDDE